ncbi:hypothetical protein [Pseudonocardia humida]|uniref:Uncharacterized protein n=1 Tax=Pseudonocardia humida TaxID=2800819 RepID=A0ABT0ZX74_9PSEU|nr:hypothetical protein [Pseudonocardia humida]MCO1655333.1 hypothetical protein [Pseudonocardia humida]
MTQRLRGSGHAGDAGVSPDGAASAGRPPAGTWPGIASAPVVGALTGWLSRLGGSLRHPDPAAAAPSAPGGMTVADLVSARGLTGAPPTSDAVDPSPDEPPGEPSAEPLAETASEPARPAPEPVDVEAGAAAPDPRPDHDEPIPAAGAGDPPDPGPSASLPQPADPEVLAPPWARVAATAADVEEPAVEPAADAGVEPVTEVPEIDPAAATDRLRLLPRAVIASAPEPRRPVPSPTPPATPQPIPPPAVRPPTRFSVPPRPTVVDDLSITGLTRRSRGRWGSRLFAVFFVVVYLVILLELIYSLLHPVYR